MHTENENKNSGKDLNKIESKVCWREVENE